MANKLVQRLAVMYGKPDTENPQQWFAEMDKLLKGYNERQLDKAADIVLRSHRGNRFPSVSEMLLAAEEAAEALIDRKPQPSKWPDWEPEAIEKADELIRCELGKRAADEGWIFALHTFCRKKGRLPLGAEVSGCINEARGFDIAYSDNAKSPDPHVRSLNELGDSMLRMRAYLGRVAYGEIRDPKELRAYLKDPKAFVPQEVPA